MVLRGLTLSQSLLVMSQRLGIATTSKIEIRIGNVLGKNTVYGDTSYYTNEDIIKIKSLGISTSSALANNWFDNVSPKYDVKQLSLIDSSNFTYSITLFADSILRIGDKVTVIQSNGVGKQGVVVDITDAKTFSFSRAGELVGSNFSVRRDILKPDVSSVNSNYSYIENAFANVQNTYAKYNGDILVTSSSIPSYHDTPLDFYDRKVSLDGNFSGETFDISKNHGFVTGDKIYYESYVYADDIGQTVESKFS